MIEVQVCVDHDVDVVRRNACGGQVVEQLRGLTENLDQSVRQLVADAGFDQNRLLSGLHHDRIQSDRDVVLGVGFHFLSPHDFGNDAEESSSVQPVNAVRNGDEFEVAQG